MKLDFEWINPEEAKGPELRATWASLEISVGGHAISFIDHRSRSVRKSLFLPLYPLAEWIATHWWFLFYELETPGRGTANYYEQRHNLRYGAEGYAVPSLTVQPLGERIKLEWRPALLGTQQLEFTASGSSYVSAAELRHELTAFISAVLGRLHDLGIEGTLLEEEWSSIQTVDAEESDFCTAVASLGLDPYSLAEPDQRKILAIGERLPAPLRRDFFAVADFPMMQVEASQVLEALESSRNNRVNLESLKLLKDELATAQLQGLPWRQGYELAHQLRRQLNLNGERLNSLSLLGEALNIPVQDLKAAIIKIADLPGSLDALVATNVYQSPGFAVPRRRQEEAIRFTFCRALFEYLTTQEGQPLLVTRTRSERQKRNRAFAAEFLVPADLLREALPGHTIGDDDVDDLAASFGVSSSVIRHQIENHNLAIPLSD